MVEVLFIIAILIFFAVWAYCKTGAIKADTAEVPDEFTALGARVIARAPPKTQEEFAEICRNNSATAETILVAKRKPRKRKKRQ